MNKIQKKICREELKSRIPGLFAYIEENEDGEFILHKATDSLQGCYDKIIENIMLPENINLIINGEYILSEGNVYSYRTMMNIYYEYKDTIVLEGEEDLYDLSFIEFIERGIGKIEVVFDEIGLNEEENSLAPHFIYISNVRSLIREYQKMSAICNEYEDRGKDSNICCMCEKYERMGGDTMLEYLITLLDDADEIANEYYNYAVKDDDKISINLNISLTQSVSDLGYLSPYLNPWVGGEKHFKGELYTYDGETYVCMEDNNDGFNEQTMRFEFLVDEEHFLKLKDVNTFPSGEEHDMIISSTNPYGNQYEFFKINEGDVEPQPYVPYFYSLNGSADSKLTSFRRYRNYITDYDRTEKPNKDEDWLFYYQKGLVLNYNVITDELGNIVSFSNPYNDDGTYNPARFVDDLMAFGNVISDITVDSQQHTITFEYHINAHLVATEVESETDSDGNTIYRFDEFYYNHPEGAAYEDTDGVVYKETYTYDKGSDLEQLASDEGITVVVNGTSIKITFDDYVNGINREYLNNYRFEFRTSNNRLYYQKRLESQIVSESYLKSDFETGIKNYTDCVYADLYKDDYLNGITFKPEVWYGSTDESRIKNNSIRIDRGNYSAFERHLKLGEIKTMEALEEYSYFKVVKG